MISRQMVPVLVLLLPLIWCGPIQAQNTHQEAVDRIVFFVQ
jgi:hypothetical protein